MIGKIKSMLGIGIGRAGQSPPKNDMAAQRISIIMRRLQIDPSMRRSYDRLMHKLNCRHGVPGPGKLLDHASTGKLVGFLEAEIAEFFHPSEISFVGKTGKTPFSALRDTAIRENRSIYIPSRKSLTIFVSGNTGSNLLQVYEATLPKGAAPEILPKADTQIVAIPISTTIEASPHGVIIITWPSTAKFDPLVVLPILRSIGHDMAFVMKRNNLTL